MNNIDLRNCHYRKLFINCPDKFYKLVIADPPYGINVSKMSFLTEVKNTVTQKNGKKLSANKNKTPYKKLNWDNKIPNKKYFSEVKRIADNFILFGANYFPEITGKPKFKAPRKADWDNFIKENPTGWIIWDKVNGSNDFSDCELIFTSFNFPSHIYSFMWAGMNQGKGVFTGNIMQGDKSLNQKRIHPTEKPIFLYEYIIKKFCKNGDTIVDTHAGSLAIAIAVCKANLYDNMNLKLTATEINKGYFIAGTNRINKFNKQKTIFDT